MKRKFFILILLSLTSCQNVHDDWIDSPKNFSEFLDFDDRCYREVEVEKRKEFQNLLKDRKFIEIDSKNRDFEINLKNCPKNYIYHYVIRVVRYRYGDTEVKIKYHDHSVLSIHSTMSHAAPSAEKSAFIISTPFRLEKSYAQVDADE